MGGFFFVLFLIAGGVVLVVVLIYRHQTGMRQAAWQAGGGSSPAPDPDALATRASVGAALAGLRSADDGFSQTLLEDFLSSLYAETQTARSDLSRMAAYLSDDARAAYTGYPADTVRDVIVGGMTITEVRALTRLRRVELTVRFETNLTEVSKGRDQSFYVEEEWVLVRNADARSRDPEAARVIGCPCCGAPLDKVVGGVCRYCNKPAGEGEVDWYVTVVRVQMHEPRGPILTGTTEEVGTDLPTVVAPDLKAAYGELTRRDPGFVWSAFNARVEHVFRTFHAAWTARDLKAIRPFLSDGLFERQRYWIRAYEETGLRNVSEGAHIVSVQVARVLSDKHYDAITVRVYASGLDYTLDEQGKVVGGDRRKPREYSEYWTFIRGRAASGPARTDAACPSCGAPLAISMAGHCEHCNAKVTRGDFDWVLSRMEQDESYTG